MVFLCHASRQVNLKRNEYGTKHNQPTLFTYKTDELLIELLGGLRIDGLDRMRVTINVTVVNRKHKEYLNNAELAGLSVRHNLDLYNDTPVLKFSLPKVVKGIFR